MLHAVHTKRAFVSQKADSQHGCRGLVVVRLMPSSGVVLTHHETPAQRRVVRHVPRDGPPRRLALVTVLQFLEGLSDRQAAAAVRSRIDWKYALALDLADPGFDYSVLSECRARLVAGRQELLLLDRMLARFTERGLLKMRGRQRTDSTHVLAAVRAMNRLDLVAETLRAALNAVATAAPDWLRGVAPAAWYERYVHRIEDYRLPEAARYWSGAARPTASTSSARRGRCRRGVVRSTASAPSTSASTGRGGRRSARPAR